MAEISGAARMPLPWRGCCGDEPLVLLVLLGVGCCGPCSGVVNAAAGEGAAACAGCLPACAGVAAAGDGAAGCAGCLAA